MAFGVPPVECILEPVRLNLAQAAAARHDLLRQRFSCYEDDLVALTWDRASIYEPRGDSDVADMPEVANAQLLEVRDYDELLDAELRRMYDLIQRTRRAGMAVATLLLAKLSYGSLAWTC